MRTVSTEVRAQTQGTTTTRFREPVFPEQEYLDEVLAEFHAAVRSAVLEDVPESHERSRISLINEVKFGCDSLEQWVHRTVRENALWYAHVRHFNALRAGIADGIIVLSSRIDIELFLEICSGELSIMPEHPDFIEHYVQTGEVMELMHRAALYLGHKSIDEVRERLLALYFYDIAQEKQSREQGEDMNLLPLEMRLAFSGFYDEGDS